MVVVSEPHSHLGFLPLNPPDPHCYFVWSTPVTRSSDGQSYIISWTGDGATGVTYRISVNGGAEVTGESVVYHGGGGQCGLHVMPHFPM